VTVAFVQQSTAVGSGGVSQTTRAATLPSVTSGNTLICFVDSGSGPAISGVSGAGATWVSLYSPSGLGAPIAIYAGYGYATSGTTVTITVTFASTTESTMQVLEFSGLGSAAPTIDVAGSDATGTGTVATCPTITPATAGDLLLSWIATGAAGTGSPSAGWTGIGANANFGVGGYIIDAGTTPETLSWSQASSSGWQGVSIALAADTGGGGGGGGGVPIVVNQFSASLGEATAASIVVAVPTVTAGRVLIALVSVTSPQTTTAVSGCGATWSLLYLADGLGVWAGYNYVTDASSQNATATNSASSLSAIQVMEVSNLNVDGTGKPIIDGPGVVASATSASIAGPTITPASVGDLLISWSSAPAKTFSGSPEAGWTSMTPRAQWAGAYMIETDASAQGMSSWTISGSVTWFSIGIGLQAIPAAAIPPITMAPMRGL
jgi:hypothetical protein